MQCLLTAKAFFSRLFPFNRIAYVGRRKGIYVGRRKGRDVGDEKLWTRQLDKHAPKKDNRRQKRKNAVGKNDISAFSSRLIANCAYIPGEFYVLDSLLLNQPTSRTSRGGNPLGGVEA